MSGYEDIEMANRRIDELEGEVAVLEDAVDDLKGQTSDLECDLRVMTAHRDELQNALDEALPDLREALRVLGRV